MLRWLGKHKLTNRWLFTFLLTILLHHRRLFERVASMKFSSKKMKFLFKKWIQFEKANGSEDDVQRVKEKTLAYVESMS